MLERSSKKRIFLTSESVIQNSSASPCSSTLFALLYRRNGNWKNIAHRVLAVTDLNLINLCCHDYFEMIRTSFENLKFVSSEIRRKKNFQILVLQRIFKNCPDRFLGLFKKHENVSEKSEFFLKKVHCCLQAKKCMINKTERYEKTHTFTRTTHPPQIISWCCKLPIWQPLKRSFIREISSAE